MQSITRNMEYLDRSYWPQDGGFRCHLFKPQSCASMSAVGIAMLSLGGHRDSEKIETAAKYLVSNPWSEMGRGVGEYAAYYIGLAALHLGEPYWSQLYPPILATILEAQQPDGSWPLGDAGEKFSPVYTTAV